MFRLVRGLIVTLAAAYALIVVALWCWQASFIFQPSAVVQTTPSDLGVKFEKVTLPIGNGQVTGWWVPSQGPHSATLLYSHGNANNVGGNAPQVVGFQKAGLNVFIYDYRGYGESTGGPPREKLAYQDAERAWTYLVSERRIAPATIVIYGHSLGGVVAIDLASKHPEAGALITESTLTSIADLADGMDAGRLLPVRLILTERFDALSRLRAVHVPTLIPFSNHPKKRRRSRSRHFARQGRPTVRRLAGCFCDDPIDRSSGKIPAGMSGPFGSYDCGAYVGIDALIEHWHRPRPCRIRGGA